MSTGLLEAVTDAPWGDVSQKDYTIGQWRRASLIGPAEPTDVKGDYKLQVRTPNGDLSRAGCHAAAARINQVDAPDADVKAAARVLVGLYRGQLDEEPPESLLAMAGMAAESRRLVAVTPLGEARPSGRRMRIKVITPGWGSSGYYSPPVLAQVGKEGLIPAGTHMYLDHPTATEDAERPERSVRDLAAVTVTTAVWDPVEQALMAEAETFAPYRDLLAEQAPHIGVSIRATGLAEHGEAEGRTGTIITRITEVMSVDFVTAAGRGGEIVALLESARGMRIQEARNVGAWLEAGLHTHFTVMADRMYGEGRLTRDERICLSSAVGDALSAFVTRVEADAPHLYARDIWADPDAGQYTDVAEAMPGGQSAETIRRRLADLVTDTYGGKDIWTYVEDFTDTDVVFRVEGADGAGSYRQAYTVTGDAMALAGDRVEVRATTTYEPVTRPVQSTESVAAATESTPAAGATSSGGPATHPEPPGGVDHSIPSREGDGHMADVPDTELASLREAASRTLTAEAALAEAQRNLSEARAQVEGIGRNAERLVEAERNERAAVAESRRLQAILDAGPVIDRALSESELPGPLWAEVRALVTGEGGRAIPLTEAGTVDADALDVAITAAIDTKRATYARVLEATGAGQVRGLGESAGDLTDVTADLEREFQAFGLDESAAKAAAGRG